MQEMSDTKKSVFHSDSADDVKKWWIWGYWTSPLMYAQNGILVNEFNGHSWRKVSVEHNLYINNKCTVSRTHLSISDGNFPIIYSYFLNQTEFTDA